MVPLPSTVFGILKSKFLKLKLLREYISSFLLKSIYWWGGKVHVMVEVYVFPKHKVILLALALQRYHVPPSLPLS